MTENYKPTSGEVLGQIITDTKNFSKAFLFTASAVQIAPYFLPTIASSIIAYENNNNFESFIDKSPFKNIIRSNEKFVENGKNTGLIFGIIGLLGQAGWYANQAFSNGNYKLLLIPVATNGIIGAYELGQHWYNDAQKRIANKNQVTGVLEQKVS